MRSLLLVLALAGCTHVIAEPNPVDTADQYVGLQEVRDRKQLTVVLGVDPVRTEWCAAFVNAVLDIDHIPSLNSLQHPYPLMARSFLSWGEGVDPKHITVGDIVVFPRGRSGWQGHVGFYARTVIVDSVEYWVILGGNQDQQVGYDLYRADRALGVRRWQQSQVDHLD